MAMSAWHVETDAKRLRRLGKLSEELGELQAVVARCIIQGVNEIDPSSGKENLQRMSEEIADVYAQMELTIEQFGLDTEKIRLRVFNKMDQMSEWEALVQTK